MAETGALRDEFAAVALPIVWRDRLQCRRGPNDYADLSPAELADANARAAYEVADAMMKAREKSND
jgi:hypothetical protein